MPTSNDPLPFQQEWGGAESVRKVFDIGATVLYYHLKHGNIESKLLRLPGNQRGKRLFNFASIRRMLDSLPNGDYSEVPWARKDSVKNTKGRRGRLHKHAA
jgi:hypothetical protein